MASKTLLVARLGTTAKLPEYSHSTDAGLDVCSSEHVRLEPGQRSLIRTGISIQLPPGTEAQVRPKSGLALNYGVTVLNAPGTIDQGYRGELMVLLINLGSEAFAIQPGMKIAQLVVSSVVSVAVKEIDKVELSTTKRGSGGFGSTSTTGQDR